MKKVAMLIFSCWLFGSCTTYKPDNLPSKQLRFGSGGGMTGAVKEYVLLENGQLFTRTTYGGDALTELPKVKKGVAKGIFKTYEKEGLNDVEVDNPGNHYCYIDMQEDDTNHHKMTWGDDEGTPAIAKSFYKQLTDLVKAQKK